MTRTSTRLGTLGAVAAVAVLVLSACSGGNDDGGVASAGGEENPANPVETEDTAPVDPDAQALIFAECMRDNGMDMPDPGPGQQGLGAALRSVAEDQDQQGTLQQALSACQELLPQYASDDVPADDLLLELAECLREQGLDVSDNPYDDAHTGGLDVGEFSAAMEVCRDVESGSGQ